MERSKLTVHFGVAHLHWNSHASKCTPPNVNPINLDRYPIDFKEFISISILGIVAQSSKSFLMVKKREISL